MKGKWAFLLLALAVSLTACGSGEKTEKSEEASKAPENGVFEKLASSPIPKSEKEPSPEMLAAVVDVSAAFSAQLLPGEGNVSFSPFSVYSAAAMLEPLVAKDFLDMYAGAMALKPHKLEPDALPGEWAAIVGRDNFSDEGYVEDVANSLWLNANMKYDPKKLDAVSREFGADVFRADFNQPDAVQKHMAGWINEKTKGFLKDVSPYADPNMSLALFNTLYFKDRWASKKSDAGELEFAQQNGSKKKVPFVESTETASYFENQKYQGASFSFLNGATMYLFLPKGELETILDETTLSEILSAPLNPQAANAAEVHAFFPKFEISSKFPDLETTMGKLGFAFLMDPEKPALFFLEEGDPGNVIDKVIQETRIKVDENGAEAAAYTEIAVRATGAMPAKKSVELRFDRPFLFVLASRSGVPLFAGCVRTFE